VGYQRYAAVADAEDLEPIAVIVKANPVIAEAEAQFGRISALEPLHVAFLSREKAREPVQEIEGVVAVDGANIGSGLVCPGNLFCHFLLAAG
jgi:hypothetical protein